MHNPHGKLQNRTKHCSFQTPMQLNICVLPAVDCLGWLLPGSFSFMVVSTGRAVQCLSNSRGPVNAR